MLTIMYRWPHATWRRRQFADSYQLDNWLAKLSQAKCGLPDWIAVGGGERMVSRCKRCGHTEAYAGPLLDGICGSCGDDLRQEALADWYADLLPDLDERLYEVREQEAYSREEQPK